MTFYAGNPKPEAAKVADLLPVGTPITFLRTLDEAANEDHPGIRYARRGESGTVVRHGCREGHWVKTDGWPTPFGATRGVEFIPADPAFLTEDDLRAAAREAEAPADFARLVRWVMRSEKLGTLAAAVGAKTGAGVSLTRTLGNIAEAVHGKARRNEFLAALFADYASDLPAEPNNPNPTNPSTP